MLTYAHVNTCNHAPAHVNCPLTCMCLMMLLFIPALPQWTIMYVCDGENEVEEVISAWFSELGGYAVDEKEADDIEDDMEGDTEDKIADGPLFNLS